MLEYLGEVVGVRDLLPEELCDGLDPLAILGIWKVLFSFDPPSNFLTSSSLLPLDPPPPPLLLLP